LPDGQGIIQQARNGENNSALYKVDLKSGEVITALNADSRWNGSGLSPDGRTVYAAARNGDRAVLSAFDLASGKRTEIPQAGYARGVAVSPDGRSIALLTTDAGAPPRAYLSVADADGRNSREILSTDNSNELSVRAGLRWSPDSRFIYFLRGAEGLLWRIPATGGAATFVGQLAKTPARTFELTHDGRQVIFGTDSGFTVEVWALENLLPGRTATQAAKAQR
jgi:Tol biopolymer transport system component